MLLEHSSKYRDKVEKKKKLIWLQKARNYSAIQSGQTQTLFLNQ